jgi:uncharacterized alkaline shock family protein YloU
MSVFSGIVLTFYTFVFMFLGSLLIAYALHLKQIIDLTAIFDYVRSIPNLWFTSGGVGLLMIFISLSVSKLALTKFQRERTIAFLNPDGQVTISLSAIEDFIKRISANLNEIKELRPHVKATRKFIDISCRITLWSDTNIPDATEKIQTLIRTKVQEMLGVEEQVMVKIHVVKIVHREVHKEKNQESGTPFRSYDFRA